MALLLLSTARGSLRKRLLDQRPFLFTSHNELLLLLLLCKWYLLGSQWRQSRVPSPVDSLRAVCMPFQVRFSIPFGGFP